ncbi:tyrosine-type recombinase/integrase [Halobellus clavatus]|nr:site-specific integrase [Halobellus clavatus]
MFDKSEPNGTEFPMPIVSSANQEALMEYAPLKREEYREFKFEFLKWLLTRGKAPIKGNGYSETTVRQTHYKIEKAYRWKWEENGFTTSFSADDADQFCTLTLGHPDHSDKDVTNYVKAFHRLFKWFNETRSHNIDWKFKHQGELSPNQGGNSGHYLKRWELSQLYEAAIEVGSVKSYYNKGMSSAEREKIKSYLAQRLEKPKSEITSEDFKRANSWKWPSIVATSIDCGLRPIEVGRATVDWVNLDDGLLVIPKDESTKNEEHWESTLRDKTVRVLSKWLNERDSYEKYHLRDELWLTKYDNPYSSNSLNSIFQKLLDEANIKPNGRDLSWYAIRRGSATMWANNAGLHEAKDQLRHKKLSTTQKYVKSSNAHRKEIVNDLW